MTAEDQTVGDAAGTRDADPLRLASYNLRYAGLDAGSLAWERRRDRIASIVESLAPDVLALQECWLDQLDDLRGRLPAYDWLTAPDASGEHTPIGYRPDRLTAVSSGGFGLAPGGERGVVGWDAELPRTATHATFRDARADHGSPADRRFTCCSVHLDHRGERARVEGARLVRDRLPDGPAVVAGDCNAEPGSEPYRVFTTAGLTDARAVAETREGPDATYVGFDGRGGGEAEPPDPRRIDYAFVRGFDVARYRVVADESPPERRASDHRAVCVDLRPTRATL